MTDARPIGFFDSGVGGLTVLREVVRRLPGESTIYLGDNLRAPYGPRSDDEVRRFSAEGLDELAARDVKAIVLACNTSSAIALGDLRRRYDVPIMGVVHPGAIAAVAATRNRQVGVIATAATIRSHAYFSAIKEQDPFVEVYEHATPALVPLVEAGTLDGPTVEATVRRALAPLLGEGPDAVGGEAIFPVRPSAHIDTLLLGCTHYPLLAHTIRAIARPGLAVIDSASAAATELASLLEAHDLAAPVDVHGRHVQLTTGDTEAFTVIARRLFGQLFPTVERVALRETTVAPGTMDSILRAAAPAR